MEISNDENLLKTRFWLDFPILRFKVYLYSPTYQFYVRLHRVIKFINLSAFICGKFLLKYDFIQLHFRLNQQALITSPF